MNFISIKHEMGIWKMLQTFLFSSSGIPINESGVGVWGDHWYCNMIERFSQKLRISILLQVWTSNLSISSWGRGPKPIICMVFGFSDVSMTPQTEYSYLRSHNDTPNNSRQFPESFIFCFCKSQNVGT